MTWGKVLWSYIHHVAWSMDDTVDTDAYRSFFQWISLVLPCPDCKAHYDRHLTTMYMYDNSYFKWTIEVHNDVNERLKRPTVPYHGVKEQYTSVRRNPISTKGLERLKEDIQAVLIEVDPETKTRPKVKVVIDYAKLAQLDPTSIVDVKLIRKSCGCG
jgi:hypothetical protein